MNKYDYDYEDGPETQHTGAESLYAMVIPIICIVVLVLLFT